MKRDFISISSFKDAELFEMFGLAQWLKVEQPCSFRPLEHKSVALIFEKPSLRTYVSFEVGISQLGGHAVFLSQQQVGLSTRESVRDIAEVLSRYNDCIVARTIKHETIETLAEYASVPVINALTDISHPCQIMADAFTLLERGLISSSTKITFIGDGNNIVNSWLELAGKIPLHFVLACPEGYEPNANILASAQQAGMSRIELIRDPFEATQDADVLYTDVWVSMGQEQEASKRKEAFQEYQIDLKLLEVARPDCVIMHCLPAHRGEEITADVLEGDQSIVLEQAENRLHVQKAIIAFLFGYKMPEQAVHHEVSTEFTL
ncbi:MAG: ornithine carbamoyltransferase [Ignavibacteriae bacterium]|nr:ornithine carbamoyltransferase [Ignavibacteriota bacterium]